VEFHGHGGAVHGLAGLAGFWRAIFSESLEINGNLRILNEITGKFVTLN
jgi:hypothetical protein